MAHSRPLTLFLLWTYSVLTRPMVFIDDLYSSNDIYLAWSVSSVIESLTFEYRECGTDEFISTTINDASKRYNRSNVYSATLNHLTPDTIYQIKISPEHDHMYRVRTLSLHDDWQFYFEKLAPYAAGAVGAVVLAPIVLDMVGFGSVGITAGSAAAAIQSEIGLVEAGSTFSILQSAGMGGISAETLLGVALRGAGIVGRIAELVEDECHDTDYVRLMEQKLENIQCFVIKHIDEIDIKSLKECIVTYVNDVDADVDVESLWDLVQSKYNTAYSNVVRKMSEVDWEKQKNVVTGTYEKVKHKVMNAIAQYW